MRHFSSDSKLLGKLSVGKWVAECSMAHASAFPTASSEKLRSFWVPETRKGRSVVDVDTHKESSWRVWATGLATMDPSVLLGPADPYLSNNCSTRRWALGLRERGCRTGRKDSSQVFAGTWKLARMKGSVSCVKHKQLFNHLQS